MRRETRMTTPAHGPIIEVVGATAMMSVPIIISIIVNVKAFLRPRRSA